MMEWHITTTMQDTKQILKIWISSPKKKAIGEGIEIKMSGNENRANLQARYEINANSLEKENVSAMGRSSRENSFALMKPKFHYENATLRILCHCQSDLHVRY